MVSPFRLETHPGREFGLARAPFAAAFGSAFPDFATAFASDVGRGGQQAAAPAVADDFFAAFSADTAASGPPTAVEPSGDCAPAARCETPRVPTTGLTAAYSVLRIVGSAEAAECKPTGGA